MATTKKSIKKIGTPIDERETFVSLQKNFADSESNTEEKLRILRSEKPDPSPSALYGRALLELVYGSPKTFKAFVDKHKRIEGMKAFYVVYELERLKQ